MEHIAKINTGTWSKLDVDDYLKKHELTDVVKFNGCFYIITQIQKYPVRKNTQFHNEQQYITYLSLRG
jgi:hypothetical protein